MSQTIHEALIDSITTHLRKVTDAELVKAYGYIQGLGGTEQVPSVLAMAVRCPTNRDKETKRRDRKPGTKTAKVVAKPVIKAAPKRAAKVKSSKATGQKRTATEIEQTKIDIISVVTEHPGMGSEDIRKDLELVAKDIALPLRQLVAAGALKTQGRKRATKYYAKGAALPAVKSEKPAKAKRDRKAKVLNGVQETAQA